MKKKNLVKKKAEPYVYIAPTVVLMGLLLIIPIINVIRYSFYDNAFIVRNPQFVELETIEPSCTMTCSCNPFG